MNTNTNMNQGQGVQQKVSKPRQPRQQQVQPNILNNQAPKPSINRQLNVKKMSHKIKNKQPSVSGDNNVNGGIKKNRPMTSRSQKVSFNLKNNHVEKFYCPQLIVNKLNKPQQIDLELIPDLPEIPLDSLIGTQ